jgi:hypothetical protein
MGCGCKNKQAQEAQPVESISQQQTSNTNPNSANAVQEAIKSTLNKYYNVSKK